MTNLFRYEIHDGYEQGGRIYFRFQGQEMVAILRSKAQFDKHWEQDASLRTFANSEVSPRVYEAAVALEALIPEKPDPNG